ncbi:MAG TPA: cell division protein ZapB [Vicinamibacterales bacterium]|nr:cell division protein ZapB [Vicinamibacterales bacterium]
MATTTTTTKTPSSASVEPIDRLEEKIKMLVGVIGRLRGEQSRAMEENARLQREVDTLNGRVSQAETAASDLGEMRNERDQIRTRVAEMLQQLDALNL